MQFIESVTHVIKQDSYTMVETYNDVISEMLFKVSCTANSIEYSESRVVGIDWCKEHGEDFIQFSEVTQEQLVEWAKGRISEEEITKMKEDLREQILFHSRTAIEV